MKNYNKTLIFLLLYLMCYIDNNTFIMDEKKNLN